MRTLTRAALPSLLLSLLASGLPVAAAPVGEGPVAADELAAEAAPLADPPVLVSPIDGATSTGASDPPLGVPTLRWMPVTGATLYHVQLSASAGFATVVVEKDTYATTYTPEIAFADGTYYWRVKARIGTTWEAYANAWTFSWDRVDGAAGYRLQVDDDSNFSTPLINKNVDATSYTPTTVFVDGTYYWRVTIRRSDTVFGHWTPTMSFVKSSRPPQTLAPAADKTVNTQPSFTWTAVLTPTVTPRLAAPRYRLQLSTDPNFSANLKTIDTDSASYTLKKGESLADGNWYWRVAVLQDAVSKPGAYSTAQRFYKEYRSPDLLSPAQGSSTSRSPQFEWAPLAGAAYYRIQIANNELFNSATTATTDATRYTPLAQLKQGAYFWRVQMIDADGKIGPYELGRVRVGNAAVYLPTVLR